MISFRVTVAVGGIVIENNDFALSEYGLVSNPFFVASGKLTVKNNKVAGVEEANLFFEGTVLKKPVEDNQFS